MTLSAYKIKSYLTEHAENFGINNFSVEHSRDGLVIALFNKKCLLANLEVYQEDPSQTLTPHHNDEQNVTCLKNYAQASTALFLNQCVIDGIYTLFSEHHKEKTEKQEIKPLSPQEKLALMIAFMNAIKVIQSTIGPCHEQDIKSTFDAVITIMVRKN
uniref:Uncharacterized protein n=1 Tax=Arsenophonus endosymbiont of Trialeurodes vaporariorum TaxID=235567 RepID=A0A3B0LX46_9GAMM